MALLDHTLGIPVHILETEMRRRLLNTILYSVFDRTAPCMALFDIEIAVDGEGESQLMWVKTPCIKPFSLTSILLFIKDSASIVQ